MNIEPLWYEEIRVLRAENHDLLAQLTEAELAKHQASALRRDADDELEAVTSERDALREERDALVAEVPEWWTHTGEEAGWSPVKALHEMVACMIAKGTASKDDALAAHLTAKDLELAALREAVRVVEVVFDAPPGPVSPCFVEVEDTNGKSISIGEWIERKDGYWALQIRALAAAPAEEE